MFVQAQQPSTTTTPFMAPIATDFPSIDVPTFGFLLSESPHLPRTSSANLPHLNNQGLYRACNQMGGDNKMSNEIRKGRKRGRRQGMGVEGLIKNEMCSSSSSSMDADIAVMMQKELEDIDLFLLMQTEKIRAEMEEKRRNYWSGIFRVVEERLQRLLKSKEEEIAKMSRINTVLEQRVGMLLIEGHNWKSIAQSREAAALSLQRDLEMAQWRKGEGDNNGEIEDTMSCCGGRKKEERENMVGSGECEGCGKNEISVLVLPCRHLCLCSDCDSKFVACPLCMSPKTGSIKVFMS